MDEADDKLARSMQREYAHNFQTAFTQLIADGCDDVQEATLKAKASADEKFAEVLHELQQGQEGQWPEETMESAATSKS